MLEVGLPVCFLQHELIGASDNDGNGLSGISDSSELDAFAGSSHNLQI